METVKETTTAKVKEPKKVELYVERGAAHDDPNHYISINCVNYILPRGKTSLVPPHVAEEYYRSQKAQQRLDEHKDELLNQKGN